MIMSRISPLILLIGIAPWLTGCFTGIESTPAITDREVQRASAPTSPDDNYLSSVLPTPVRELKRGALWVVNDSRIDRVFGAEAHGLTFTPGDTLTFESLRKVTTLDGRTVGEALFVTQRADTLCYRVNKSYDELMADSSMTIPFATEGALIDKTAALVGGKEFYVITASRFDTAGQACTGRKFVPVKVQSVGYGNGYYPLSLTLLDDCGESFKLFMSVGSGSVMPRKFGSLLSLTNPRAQYPTITDEVWQHIINGTTVAGMTQPECRLALGRPSDIVRQVGYSSLVEVWTYADGKRLIFADGILQ